MDLLYILFSILLLDNHFLSNNVDGLGAEKIVGGTEVRRSRFKYVVALMYKVPGQNDVNPCSASILSDWYVATAAHCFYCRPLGLLRNTSFYFVAGTPDLRRPTQWSRYPGVDTVTIPKAYDPRPPTSFYTRGNLAVVKLNESLDITPNHPTLSSLYIRYNELRSINVTLFVAGYGLSEVEIGLAHINEHTEYVQIGEPDGRLRYAHANILTIPDCENRVHGTVARGNMCVKISRKKPDVPAGICQGDSGAPLVYNNYLDGIAIKGFLECDEEQMPGIYIYVFYYRAFIDNIMRGYRSESMLVLQLQRRPHNQYQFVAI